MAVKMKNLVTDKFYFQLSISLIEERWFLKVLYFLVSGKDETFNETFLNFVCSHNRNNRNRSCPQFLRHDPFCELTQSQMIHFTTGTIT